MSTSACEEAEGKHLTPKMVKSCNVCLRSIRDEFREFSFPGYTNPHYAPRCVTLKSHEGGCALPQSSKTEVSVSKTNIGNSEVQVSGVYLLKLFIYIYTHLPTEDPDGIHAELWLRCQI